MTTPLEAGMKFCVEHIVLDNETAISYDSGAMAVYATPALVSIMECAAFKLAQAAGYDTVGTIVNIEHKKACLPGSKVFSYAELTAVDGKKLMYKVKVTDKNGTVLGEGTHGRYIIDPERFMGKVELL